MYRSQKKLKKKNIVPIAIGRTDALIMPVKRIGRKKFSYKKSAHGGSQWTLNFI
jgi:hypothetical protein